MFETTFFVLYIAKGKQYGNVAEIKSVLKEMLAIISDDMCFLSHLFDSTPINWFVSALRTRMFVLRVLISFCTIVNHRMFLFALIVDSPLYKVFVVL